MTEIKPCPFCGTEWSADPDATMVQVYHNGPCEEWMVFCEGCGTESSNYSTLDEAIAAWDQRTPDPEALITGLREAVAIADSGPANCPINNGRQRDTRADCTKCGSSAAGNCQSIDGANQRAVDAMKATLAHLDSLLPEDK